MMNKVEYLLIIERIKKTYLDTAKENGEEYEGFTVGIFTGAESVDLEIDYDCEDFDKDDYQLYDFGVYYKCGFVPYEKIVYIGEA